MKDCTGREIKEGDVISHCVRRGSTMHFNMGVVRKVFDDSIFWQAVRERFLPPDTNDVHWHYQKMLGNSTQIYRTEYSTITGLTEAEMMAMAGLAFQWPAEHGAGWNYQREHLQRWEDEGGAAVAAI